MLGGYNNKPAHPVPEAPIRTVMSRVFAATCTEFERRISCQKRDGRLITRPSPFDHLTEE